LRKAKAKRGKRKKRERRRGKKVFFDVFFTRVGNGHCLTCLKGLTMGIDELTGLVIGACFKVHSRVGSGCLEKVYEELLHYELCLLGLDVLRQQTFPVKYDHLFIPNGFRLDLFVDLQLPLEIKAVNPLAPIHFDQVKSQLALLNLKNGMLLNFRTPHMKHGIHPIFNNSGKLLLDTTIFPIKKSIPFN
jgi:GxxExxY protein